MKDKKLSDLTVTDVCILILKVFDGIVIGFSLIYLLAWLLG